MLWELCALLLIMYLVPLSRSLLVRTRILSRQFRINAKKQSPQRDGLGKPKGYVSNSQYVVERSALSGLPEKIAKSEPFTVLGIESSCDDTGAAVVRSDGTVLSNVVYSQHEIHEKFGGIVPSLAMNAHKDNIEKAVTRALAEAGMQSVDEVDAIAVTKGPGLEICLRIGCRKAQALAIHHKKPFVAVHHLEAHCVIARLAGAQILPEADSDSDSDSGSSNGNGFGSGSVSSAESMDMGASGSSGSSGSNSGVEGINRNSDKPLDLDQILDLDLPHYKSKVQYPFLALLVSGGHTSLLVCRGIGTYELLGGTLDDSLGESFDKASRLLGLRTAASGGAAVEAAAARSKSSIRAKQVRIRAKQILFDLEPGQKLAGEDKEIVRQYRRAPGAVAAELFQMKVPMRNKKNCDFSYAGLKNSFRMAVGRARAEAGIDGARTDNKEGDVCNNKNIKVSTNAPSGQMVPLDLDTDIVALPEEAADELCYHFQDIAFTHVEDRVKRALDWVEHREVKKVETNGANAYAYANANGSLGNPDSLGGGNRVDGEEGRNGNQGPCTALVVVGGVAANKELRRRLLELLHSRSVSKNECIPSSQKQQHQPLPLIFPPVGLCTDNGVMVAWAGVEKLLMGVSDEPEGQEVVPRWPLGKLPADGQWG